MIEICRHLSLTPNGVSREVLEHVAHDADERDRGWNRRRGLFIRRRVGCKTRQDFLWVQSSIPWTIR